MSWAAKISPAASPGASFPECPILPNPTLVTSRSKAITDRIDRGDLSDKPGWTRLSFHPSTTMADIDHALQAVAEVVANIDAWSKDYLYSPRTNEYSHRDGDAAARARVQSWFAAGRDQGNFTAASLSL